ncbi:MAG: caspase family protein, partial [Gammaproteobacteria bacterium]|nr:caspase family protein [Gammaproteobacteria bacterium]
DIIDEAFDLEEFRDLCLDLDVEYDNLPGETKKGKAGTLVERMVRKGRPEQLVQRILELRENLSPEDVPVPKAERGEEQDGQVVVVSGEGRRWACLIGTNEYDDPDLPPLAYPEENADALARVLEDKWLGDFDQVIVLKEKTNTEVIRKIKRIAGQLKVDDLLLIYFSGYALLDEEETERLYLVAKETDPMDLPGSAIDLARIKTFLDKSEAVQKLVLLDCRYGGQKPPYQVDDPEFFEEQLRFKAKGKYLISNALEAAAVGDEDDHSLLTKCLLEGLTSGAADLDQSGKVTVEEVFTYIQRQLTDKGLPEPLKSDEGVAGTWIVSRTPGAGDDAVTVMPASLRRNYKYISEMLRDGSVIPFLGSGVVMETLPAGAEEIEGHFAEPPLERDIAQRIAERAELPEAERRKPLTVI